MNESVFLLKSQLKAFEEAAHSMLSMHEGSRSRVFTVGDTRKRLVGLSVTQSDLLDQSLKCIEHGLHRPALVMGWAAFIDFLTVKMFEDNFSKLHSNYPNWISCTSPESLRENQTEFALLDASEKIGLLTKQDNKTLKGLLSQRNQAAHPGHPNPTFSISLGYVAKIIEMISLVKVRYL